MAKKYRPTVSERSLKALLGASGIKGAGKKMPLETALEIALIVYGVSSDKETLNERAYDVVAKIRAMPLSKRRQLRSDLVGEKLEQIKAVNSRLAQRTREDKKKARAERKKPQKLKAAPRRRAKGAPTKEMKEAFYRSWDWRTLRMEVIKIHGRRCACCNKTPDHTNSSGQPTVIHVDHIKPLSTHWKLRLDINNLQILCDDCNVGKGAWDTTDWRKTDDTRRQVEKLQDGAYIRDDREVLWTDDEEIYH